MTTPTPAPKTLPGTLPKTLIDRLLDGYESGGAELNPRRGFDLPSPAAVGDLLAGLRELLFPGFVGRCPAHGLRVYVANRLDEIRAQLREQVYRGLHHRHFPNLAGECAECAECEVGAAGTVDRFLDRLPGLREELALDVQAALDGDPAACGADEVIVCYPGFYAVSAYRVAHALLREGAALIPRMMAEHAHHRTGVDIHPGATIGRSFFIDHGTGVVIGETTDIGDRVRLYQGVTLGALSLSPARTRALRGCKRHPTIEDEAIIYANATVLGGETVIGRGAVIGGNCWITRSVPPGSRISFLDANGR